MTPLFNFLVVLNRPPFYFVIVFSISSTFFIRTSSCSRDNCLPEGCDSPLLVNKGNNKITELRTILQRESQNS